MAIDKDLKKNSDVKRADKYDSVSEMVPFICTEDKFYDSEIDYLEELLFLLVEIDRESHPN